MEVVIAIALVALVTVALLNLQTRLLRNTYRARDSMQRSMLLTTFLRDQQRAVLEGREPAREQTIDTPPTRLTYRAQPPAGGSPLAKIKGLVVERVTAEWTELGQKRSERLLSLRVEPVKEQDNAR